MKRAGISGRASSVVLEMMVVLALLASGFAASAHDLVGVAASSRTDGPVLVWSESAAYRSLDGDAPFERVSLDSDLTIAGAAVEADGSWMLAWTDLDGRALIEVGDPSGGTRRIAFDSASAVAMRSAVLAVRSDDSIHVSKDRGRTFETVRVPAPCDGCEPVFGGMADLDVTLGGDVIVTDLEINTCTSADRIDWMRVLRQAGPRLVQDEIALGRADYAAAFEVGAHGWLYGMSYASRLVAYGHGRAMPVRGLPATADPSPVLVAQNGRLTLAIVSDLLVSLRGGRGRVLARDLPDVQALAVDGRGRALVLTERGLERFRRGHGFEVLAGSLP
jgi:hypothetical protein